MQLATGITLISTLLLFAQQCGKEDVSNGTPDCVQKKIEEIMSQEVWNPPAKVYSYFYEGRRVYFVPQHCCDFPSQLLDENCNEMCRPDGGFSGRGDGRCADFFDTRKSELLIWADPRGGD